jgi:hypothetical protein
MSDPAASPEISDVPPLLPPKDRPSGSKSRSPTRPGTSGTELNLRTNLKKAQTSYQRAQRAEQAYRAKRQARNARKDINAAKEHLGEAKGQVLGVGKSLKLSVVYGWKAVKAGPSVWREKREGMREEQERKKKEKIEAKNRALEEKVEKARREAEEASKIEEDGDAGEGPAPKEEAAAAAA